MRHNSIVAKEEIIVNSSNAKIVPLFNKTQEPIRDWQFGFITGHRLLVFSYLFLIIGIEYSLQDFFWSKSIQPNTFLEDISSWLSIFWLGALIPGTIGLLGMIAFKYPDDLDDVNHIPNLVCYRIVTAGLNIGVVISTVNRCIKEMEKNSLFPYVVEVVIDHGDNIHYLFEQFKDNPHVIVLEVPDNFKTENNSRFKARALHYALFHSKIPDDAWIVHLDEETQPTSSAIKGITKAIREEELSGEFRVGQGGILYHREWKEHPFLTLADNVRTGDDFARFYFQHRVGITLFGLHGSFILVRNSVEKSTEGFDFGPKGDITEDAFWALIGMSKGVRCRWVEGYLEEQSTMSLIDFLKQRRRWFQGLMLSGLFAPAAFRWRVYLLCNTLIWSLAPFGMLYTFFHMFYGFAISPIIIFLANYSLATFYVLYLIGLKANLDEHGIKNIWLRLYWTFMQIILLPIFSFMESCGVLWAIVKPGKGFHVVKK